jgi:hypothetical protein
LSVKADFQHWCVPTAATVVIFIALISSLSFHVTLALFASLLSFIAGLVTLTAFAFDIALFITVFFTQVGGEQIRYQKK